MEGDFFGTLYIHHCRKDLAWWDSTGCTEKSLESTDHHLHLNVCLLATILEESAIKAGKID